MLTELHPSPVVDTVLPSVSADVYLAREGCVRPAEQLLHHQPDGGAAAGPRVHPTGGQQCSGVSRRCCSLPAPLVPQPRGQGKPAPDITIGLKVLCSGSDLL